MLVVVVVYVLMLMLERVVSVLVHVLLGEVQPNSHDHQQSGHQQGQSDRFTGADCQYRSEKWCHGEIRGSARRTEVAQ